MTDIRPIPTRGGDCTSLLDAESDALLMKLAADLRTICAQACVVVRGRAEAIDAQVLIQDGRVIDVVARPLPLRHHRGDRSNQQSAKTAA